MESERNRQRFRPTIVYALLLGVVAVGYRLVAPYGLLGPGSYFAWNLVPVGALAMFVGARVPSPWAWLIPFGAMLLSDLLLLPAYGAESISWQSTPFVYASFALYLLIGRLVKPGIESPLRLLGASLVGSVQFFLVTNFAVWAFGVIDGLPMYPKTLTGLVECFVAAVPFSKGTFVGDLFFASLFFAGHAAILSVSRSSPAQEAV